MGGVSKLSSLGDIIFKEKATSIMYIVGPIVGSNSDNGAFKIKYYVSDKYDIPYNY